MKLQFKKVILGGTFDHFHKGHKKLIEKAFEMGEEVVIGITSDEFVRCKFSIFNSQFSNKTKTSGLPARLTDSKRVDRQNSKPTPTNSSNFLYFPLQSHRERLVAVRSYLERRGWIERFEIIKLHDAYGPAIDDESFQAILVSPETEKTAIEINKKRAAKGRTALVITVIDWVLASDGEPIHSTRIRAGEIGRDGTVFRLPKGWGVRKLPQHIRKVLQEPIGTFISGNQEDSGKAVRKFVGRYIEHDPSSLSTPQDDKSDEKIVSDLSNSKKKPLLLITVGDAVTHSFMDAGIVPAISVIDYHVQRKRRYQHIRELGFSGDEPVIRFRNSPGILSYKAFVSIQTAITSYLKKKRYNKDDRPSKIVSFKNNYRYESMDESVHKPRCKSMDKLRYKSKYKSKYKSRRESFGESFIVEVDGEEDLLTLFAILLAPLNSLVIYGQPKLVSLARRRLARLASSGIVVVEVTEEKKKEVMGWLGEFTGE